MRAESCCVTKGAGNPKSFRYSVHSKSKINCFAPAALDPEKEDFLKLKASQLGAVFREHFDKLPSNNKSSVIWEARLCCNQCDCLLF